MNPHLLAGTALLLAVFAGEAGAQKQRPARPAGKSIEVEVMRGGSVRIPLRGFERNLNRLEYKTIGSPRHGRLSQLEQYNGPERQGPGFVTYTHGDDENSTEDAFAFEVRAPTTGLRGRARVTIHILDPPPRPPEQSLLDFGAVAVGDPPARRVFVVTNRGGGVLRGRLELPPPYLVDGDGNFELGRDEIANIPILFAPEKPGSYTFSISPVLGEPATLTLRGEALRPFDVESDGFEFREQPDQSRTAGAVVKNQSRNPQRISVALPPDVPVEPRPSALELPPGASTNVTLQISAATKMRVAPFDVRFETANHVMVLEFQAPPIPPNVIVVSPPDFGQVKPGTSAKATLVLSNAGGAVANCRLQTTKNLATEDGTSAFTVAPGTAHNITLKLIFKKDEDLPTSVVVSFRDQNVSAPVKAVLAAAPSPIPSPTPTPVPFPTPTPDWELNADIKLERKESKVLIAYRQREEWSDFDLQHRVGDEAQWQSYRLPGLLGWVKSEVERLLDKPIPRQQVAGIEADGRWAHVEIATEKVGGTDTWRLIAKPSNEPEPCPVSAEFRVTSEGRLEAAGPEVPAAQAASTPKPKQESTSRPRIVGPVTEMVGGGTRSERDSALVQVAFAQELGVRGFRLERLRSIAPIDPKTQIPQASEFEKMDPPGAEVKLLGLAEGEAEGKKFTVCTARISGLPEESATWWRIVPLGRFEELPPTDPFPVKTLSRPPFPWNTLLLVALTLLLAGVLYLRWRMNRPPG